MRKCKYYEIVRLLLIDLFTFNSYSLSKIKNIDYQSLKFFLHLQLNKNQQHMEFRNFQAQLSSYEPPYKGRSPYQHITYELRRQLIDMVVEKKMSVYKACRILNINNSTAKTIVRIYRRTGKIFARKGQGDHQVQETQQRNVDQEEIRTIEPIVKSQPSDKGFQAYPQQTQPIEYPFYPNYLTYASAPFYIWNPFPIMMPCPNEIQGGYSLLR